MTYYIRGIGAFRGAGDVNRWLKIRSIKKDGPRVVIKIKVSGKEKYLALAGSHQHNMEFAKGKWPKIKTVSWHTILTENYLIK